MTRTLYGYRIADSLTTRTVKQRIAWWIVAILCIVGWLGVLAAVTVAHHLSVTPALPYVVIEKGK